jgi:twitching motility protein PilT
MPQLDSLLRIVVAQGADELRLGTDKAPSMFAAGIAKKLTIPPTSTVTLLELFGELLEPAKLDELERVGKLEIEHGAEKLGAWTIRVTRQPGGERAFDAIVKKGAAANKSAASTPNDAGLVKAVASPLVSQTSTAQPSPAATSSQPTPPRTLELPEAVSLAELDRLAAPTRPTELLTQLIDRAAALGASDLHLAEGEPPTVRIDGRLRALDDEPLRGLDALLSASFGIEALAPRREGRGVDLGFELGDGARGRLNVYQTSRGIAAALRLLPNDAIGIAQLGFPVPIEELAALPHGLVLATGPTGAGKSTTLVALAREILRRRSVLLISLEDPIEQRLVAPRGSLVRQRQVGRDVASFAVGLRDALREDPDVLLIGEMRDPESIALALTAAETGHLVLTSLHSRSAASAIERILDACPGEKRAELRTQLADSLRAVLGQRLLPRVSGTGRVLAAEVLRVTPAVSSAIREGKLSAIRTAMQSGRGEGMIPLERSIAELVHRRQISVDAARAAGCDLEALSQYLQER